MEKQFKIAKLDEAAVQKIRELEDHLGKHIMAFERGLQFASLSPADLDRISELEKELGIVLLVYEK